MRIWELHSRHLGENIRTTPDGEADISGLVLSEKAYLAILRELRPAQLLEIVRAEGPEAAAQALVARFAAEPRGLVLDLDWRVAPTIRRSDEIRARAPSGWRATT